jgi:hypothetical protein
LNQDLEHLKLLAIFHYVVAGFGALIALIPVIHLVIGVAIVTGKLPDPKNGAMPVAIGWLLIAMALVFISCGLSFATCLAVAGRFLTRRKHYMYCLVMAALACALMPFGTVLGVFTIIVLQRDSVKNLFGRPISAPPVPST